MPIEMRRVKPRNICQLAIGTPEAETSFMKQELAVIAKQAKFMYRHALRLEFSPEDEAGCELLPI